MQEQLSLAASGLDPLSSEFPPLLVPLEASSLSWPEELSCHNKIL